jgi:hypothetical protein
VAQKAGGYVKPDTKFMVTNQLEILPSSSMKALIALEMIRSERVGDLDTMEVLVVAQEVIQQAYLLRVSSARTVVCRICTIAWLQPRPHVTHNFLSGFTAAESIPVIPECAERRVRQVLLRFEAH